GRPCGGPRRTLYEHLGRHQTQPGHQSLLSTSTCGRQGTQSGARGLHAQADYDSECHGQTSNPVASVSAGHLTIKTVAKSPSPLISSSQPARCFTVIPSIVPVRLALIGPIPEKPRML